MYGSQFLQMRSRTPPCKPGDWWSARSWPCACQWLAAVNWTVVQHSQRHDPCCEKIDLGAFAVLLGGVLILGHGATLPLALPFDASLAQTSAGWRLLGLVQLAIPCALAVRVRARSLKAPEVSLLASAGGDLWHPAGLGRRRRSA